MIKDIGARNVEGCIYAIESSPEIDPPDSVLYRAVVRKYGAKRVQIQSAAGVGFAGLINLYMILGEIGPEAISPTTIMDALHSTVDHPSYMGHPYTCDGEQMGGDQRAICAPQQVLLKMTDGVAEPTTDWIDVEALVAPADRQG